MEEEMWIVVMDRRVEKNERRETVFTEHLCISFDEGPGQTLTC